MRTTSLFFALVTMTGALTGCAPDPIDEDVEDGEGAMTERGPAPVCRTERLREREYRRLSGSFFLYVEDVTGLAGGTYEPFVVTLVWSRAPLARPFEWDSGTLSREGAESLLGQAAAIDRRDLTVTPTDLPSVEVRTRDEGIRIKLLGVSLPKSTKEPATVEVSVCA